MRGVQPSAARVRISSPAPDGSAIDDYRDKQESEAQLAAFVPQPSGAAKFAEPHGSDQELFVALEADISDLFRDFVCHAYERPERRHRILRPVGGRTAAVDGPGPIRVTGQAGAVPIDEPDTHLNPHWQYNYLDLIRDWTGVAADAQSCHIVMTSHNPLTIAALTKDAGARDVLG